MLDNLQWDVFFVVVVVVYLLYMFVQIAVSHDGQIQYVPVSSQTQVVNTEDLEAAAHSAVTG